MIMKYYVDLLLIEAELVKLDWKSSSLGVFHLLESTYIVWLSAVGTGFPGNRSELFVALKAVEADSSQL